MKTYSVTAIDPMLSILGIPTTIKNSLTKNQTIIFVKELQEKQFQNIKIIEYIGNEGKEITIEDLFS